MLHKYMDTEHRDIQPMCTQAKH